MLTTDLVHVRRRGDTLQVVPLSAEQRTRAQAIAATYVQLARAHIGESRGVLVEACGQIDVAAHERRMARGLCKLILDRCRFDEGGNDDPAELRRTLFSRAAQARKDEGSRGAFDRDGLLRTVADQRGITPEGIERALYADLPDAHRLLSVEASGPQAVVAEYEMAQIQAVLLRAVKVTAIVRGSAPGAFRRLFRKLKFLRLLHRIERLPPRQRESTGGFRIEIDGPYSLFESITKYGLQLALALPAITECDDWLIDADLRWGKDRRPLRFRLAGKSALAAPKTGEQVRAVLSDDVAVLLGAVNELDTPWRAAIAREIFELPGVGLCVPDLVFTHAGSSPPVHLEVLGFWSRDAVWKRIELAQRGLLRPLVFAVSKHLRVSEAALGDHLPALLYVYSRVLNARAVVERVEEAARRFSPKGSKAGL